MTKIRVKVKRRNLIAKDLLTSGLYRNRIELSKKKYSRKVKHQQQSEE